MSEWMSPHEQARRLRRSLDRAEQQLEEARAEVERLRKMVPKVKNAQEIVEEVRRALPVDDERRRKLLTADTLIRFAIVDAEKAGGAREGVEG